MGGFTFLIYRANRPSSRRSIIDRYSDSQKNSEEFQNMLPSLPQERGRNQGNCYRY